MMDVSGVGRGADDGAAELGVGTPNPLEGRSWRDLEEFREPETNNYNLPPQGDFAGIQVEASNDIIKRIQSTNEEAVKGAIETVFSEPGCYNPLALIEAASYLVKAKDFERAAILAVGAFGRAQIDHIWSQDESTGSVGMTMQMLFSEACKALNDQEQVSLKGHLETAQEGFEAWDRNTARKYDSRWINLHGMKVFIGSSCEELTPQQKESELERFYRESKGIYLPEDATNASMEDPYYFDASIRTFYFTDKGLTLIVPEEVSVLIDSFRKYKDSFSFSLGKISVGSGWSILPKSIKEDFESEQEHSDGESVELEMCQVNGIDAYKKKCPSVFFDKNIENTYHLVNGQHSLTFTLITSEEDEAAGLQVFETMMNSIEWPLKESETTTSGWLDWSCTIV